MSDSGFEVQDSRRKVQGGRFKGEGKRGKEWIGFAPVNSRCEFRMRRDHMRRSIAQEAPREKDEMTVGGTIFNREGAWINGILECRAGYGIRSRTRCETAVRWSAPIEPNSVQVAPETVMTQSTMPSTLNR